ncbi:hypothetical protein CLU79DRAFT_733054 [Phycomyces nitens]|nr:hypothetical protein CLU79DRAFT_733054 [Phycomyces nitens]
MKTYIHFHDFDEKDAMLIIPVHLVGVARVWYDKYILEKPFDTSEEMYTAILKNFSPLHQNLAKEKT